MGNKDWTGNKAAVFVCNGASGHAKEDREENDYYATEPVAAEWLLKIEPQIANIWETACVDKDTEYFNGSEWRKIKDYIQGEKVLCYNPKLDTSELSLPLKYHKVGVKEKLFHFTNNSLDMFLSKDHRVVFKHRRKDCLQVLEARKIFEKYEKDSNGFRGKIPVTWNDEGSLFVDENLLRLAVACNADGRMRTKFKQTYEIRVKKNRKKVRIIELLNNAGISYSICKQPDLMKRGYLGVTFESPLGCKEFPIEWINLKRELKEAFIDEITFWDGSRYSDSHKVYFTNKLKDAEIVQLIAASIGIKSTISEDRRRDNINYRVSFYSSSNTAVSKTNKSKLTEEYTEDGLQYCFSVETGMLILRRNYKIFITGNCGEGHLAKVFHNAGKLKAVSDLIDRGYHPEGIMQCFGKDFLQMNKVWKGDVVTNPPYASSADWAQHSLDIIQEGHYSALFMKLTFLEGKGRKKFFEENPPIRVWVSSSRIPCAKNGEFLKPKKDKEGNLVLDENGNQIMIKESSAACYAWFVWQKGYKGPTELKWFN